MALKLTKNVMTNLPRCPEETGFPGYKNFYKTDPATTEVSVVVLTCDIPLYPFSPGVEPTWGCIETRFRAGTAASCCCIRELSGCAIANAAVVYRCENSRMRDRRPPVEVRSVRLTAQTTRR